MSDTENYKMFRQLLFLYDGVVVHCLGVKSLCGPTAIKH